MLTVTRNMNNTQIIGGVHNYMISITTRLLIIGMKLFVSEETGVLHIG